jgi:hypothetical protein
MVASHRCGWTLMDEPMRLQGWRPEPMVTVQDLPLTVLVAACTNGHALDPGDLMCMVCNAERETLNGNAGDGTVANGGDGLLRNEPVPEQETVVDGWRLLRQLDGNGRVQERYLVAHDERAAEAILTLYQNGFEPDPAVYEVLGRLPREHVPEVYATGRWNGRAYEVTESLHGGTLADLGIVATDADGIRRIVSELGHALHALSEVGLRHRDIRPGTLVVRSREPLDLVVTGFGSARLSDFDLDIVSPLDVSRYMAPEAIAGGVAAASDWWSIGMVLLEQITHGACFAEINERAFLIHVLAIGVTLPDGLDPSIDLLLRGLLTKDRLRRWQWPQVQAWLNGDTVAAEPRAGRVQDDAGQATIRLGTRTFRQPSLFALAAAEAGNWQEASDHLARGVLSTWAQQVGVDERQLGGLRQVAQHDALEEDLRLMLALKILNPEMPLIHRGEIVTPRWLLEHPLEAYELISGAVPELLDQLGTESWLSRLKSRAIAVRARARNLGIELDEDALRVNVLSTSRARLAAVWEERRRLLPDTPHHGLLSVLERTTVGEEDLIVLLSASIGLFRSCDAIVDEAMALARANRIPSFDLGTARAQASLSRLELTQAVGDRTAGFATCDFPLINEWADRFRLERRMPLAQALVVLSVPASGWHEPQKQQYVSQILEFFEKRVSAAVMRGPLVRMIIGKSTARVDLSELGTARTPAPAVLDHLLQRGAVPVPLDPSAFDVPGSTAEYRLHSLSRHTTLYRRDTGIDGLYLGFPFLLAQDAKATIKTRIAPLLLWPVKIHLELGNRSVASLAFDNDREEVRINPALDALIGIEPAKRWRKVVQELLGRSTLKTTEVMDAFSMLARTRSRTFSALPGPNVKLPPGSEELDCSAALFHVTFIGQAIGEELRLLRSLSPAGTGLETALRLNAAAKGASGPFAEDVQAPRELDRFFTVSSDPSQEAAVLQARNAPGLLIEGPPGTGKSQTIVNIVGDAIGRRQSMLIVCQKHAALEVVHKRLVAEGLGDRVIMVNDVNRDRNPIIKAVREQVEALYRRKTDPVISVQRKRETVAARIESLEGELDRHHRALTMVDDHSGISYRTLLGELIGLEAPSPPMDLPALRPMLQKFDTARLAALEEEIAPLSRHWLPARAEGSGLAVLLEFAPDKATLADFSQSWSDFMSAERSRSEVLLARPCEFDLDDPVPHQTWLAVHGHKLLDLTDTQRLSLAKWLPLFRSADSGNVPGREQVANLEVLVQKLGECAVQHYDPQLSPVLARLPLPELATVTANTLEMIAPASWLQRLSPIRMLRGRRINTFLRAAGSTVSVERTASLHHAADLELQWHALRSGLTKAHTVLQLPAIDPVAGPQLVHDASTALLALREVSELCDHMAAAPWPDKVDAAASQGRRDAMLKLFATFHSAFARFEARRGSLDALSILGSWVDPLWKGLCHAAIASNQPNQPRLHPVEKALPTLAAYQRFRGRAKRLSTDAIAAFVLLRSKEPALLGFDTANLEHEVRRVLNREARLGWKRAMEQAEPDLLLEHAEIEGKVASLAALDLEMRAHNRDLLKDNFDLAAIRKPSEWEDITRLTGQRARRLREFIENGASLGLMKLRPIWLMNPDVASRVLPLKSALFDTVIYDEASQMPVEHALPTLFRGRISVISGDEKQMPPTAFFASKVESDEADAFDGQTPEDDASEEERELFDDTWNRREIKDCPDLLQLARTNLPNTTLQIHYRSAYRELIGFSNASFYANRLSVPVRHPESTVRKVRPIQVIRTDTEYVDQTNPGEAVKVVDVLARFWKLPYLERPSVGVVTFNRKQADLIEDVLEQRALQDPAFGEAYRQECERIEEGEDMGVFVKNVENVQGDERDIIIFSSTFGRNAQGTFRRSFGVLGQKGGERRLNVAVTRARKKIVMVTSMPVAEISDILTTHQVPSTPRDFLQGYMEYARALSAGEFDTARSLLKRFVASKEDRPAESGARTDDGFSASVGAFIKELGHETTSSAEDDAFGLDFAIEDPATKLFAIGIECDAPRHELLSRARAREVWRPSVLRRAIPTVHRISSHGWYHNPEQERARLRDAIQASLMSAETI